MLDGVGEDDAKHFFLGQLHPLGIFGDQFILLTNNEQVESWVRRNYLGEISAAALAASGVAYTVQIAGNPAAQASQTAAAQGNSAKVRQLMQDGAAQDGNAACQAANAEKRRKQDNEAIGNGESNVFILIFILFLSHCMSYIPLFLLFPKKIFALRPCHSLCAVPDSTVPLVFCQLQPLRQTVLRPIAQPPQIQPLHPFAPSEIARNAEHRQAIGSLRRGSDECRYEPAPVFG